MPAALFHTLHLAGALPAWNRFRRALREPEAAQTARLWSILSRLAPYRPELDPRWTLEQFASRVPVGDPQADIQALEAMRTGGPPVCDPPTRWQPSSGSQARKWIPYPRALLAEFDEAASAWLVDLARQVPGAFRGRHYWSLSWLPEELRGRGADPDDLQLLSWAKRLALGAAMAAPPGLATLRKAEDALFTTTAHLAACGNLSLLSVWSPTFALELLAHLSRERERLAEALTRGRWEFPLPCPRNAAAAARLRAWDGRMDGAFFRGLWPRLALVSAWDRASSAPFAAELADLLPQARFQGKGLWATEGVVTIPFRNRFLPALTSHVLEFRCLATGRVRPCWELEPGQEVQPLLTTSGGLLRHPLTDQLRVSPGLGTIPSLEFLGRLGGTDLVGEKLESVAVGGLLEGLRERFAVRILGLRACPSPRPHYELVLEGSTVPPSLAAGLEQALGAFHHYALARQLGQLEAPTIRIVPNGPAWFAAEGQARGCPGGSSKPEPLALTRAE